MCQPHSPGTQYGTFPADTERLWHHWSHHWKEDTQSKEETKDKHNSRITRRLQKNIYSVFIYVFLFHTHSSRKTSIYFPKRLELSFRTVLAFPKDSSRGAASSIYPVFKHTVSQQPVRPRKMHCATETAAFLEPLFIAHWPITIIYNIIK